MSQNEREADRRDFLKQAGAGILGAVTLGAVASDAAARGVSAEDAVESPSRRGRLLPHREILLPGLHAYTGEQSVAAGGEASFHVSSTEPYRLAVYRLGPDIDSPERDELVEAMPESPPRVQAIHPGSYVSVEKGLGPERALAALSLEVWVRPWRIGAPMAIIGERDPPRASGYALYVDAAGSPALALGGGGDLVSGKLHAAASAVLTTGRWHHVVAVWDGREAALWVDGREVERWAAAGPVRAGVAPLRLAAASRDGRADDFLDGDLAAPAIYERALDASEVRGRFASQGLAAPVGAAAAWLLAEERGERLADASGNGRDGRIINQATWMVGGPSFDATVPRFAGYDPGRDPRRGHGLRFASDDLYDAGWEVVHRVRIPDGARPGIYAGRFRYTFRGEPHVAHATFVVTRPRGRKQAPILVLAATNTWRAYNATPFAAPRPGLRHLAGTGGMANSPGDPPAFSFYRPHAGGQGTYQVGLRMPWPVAAPFVRYGDASDYSHLTRADRCLHVWLERSGYEFDVVSDLDLHRDPDMLRGYRVLAVNGHSEYWSIPMYEGVERFLAAGGGVLCLSGNTMFWRVSFSDDGAVLECRKVDAPGDQLPPSRRGECWHSHDGRRGGLLAESGYPGWKLVGLATLGWNNHGDPGHFSPFIVESAGHFLFHSPEEVGLANGEPLGEAPGGRMPRANGHEVDVRLSTLRAILESPPPEGAVHPDDPPGIQLLAAGHGWPVDAPKFDYYMRPVHPQRPIGGEVIWWERPQGGKVFNAGSIGAGWALLADPRLGKLVANALHHLGVPRPR